MQPASPDEIAQLTGKALSRGDVESLLQLTMPEERQKLRLTNDKVRGVLQDSLWAAGYPSSFQYEKRRQGSPDELTYRLTSSDLVRPVEVLITQDNHQRWHLGLSHTLISAMLARAPRGTPDDDSHLRTQLSRKFQILGERNNHTGYVFFPQTSGEGFRIEPMVWK
jgi:hypothetical protein